MVRRLIYAAAALALLLLILSTTAGCKNRPPRKISLPDSLRLQAIEKAAADTLLNHLRRQQLNYTWFVAKAKAQIESPQQNLGFSIQIRQQRDSLTWITLKKASVEGARLRFRPNSIEIIDRQNNEYLQTDFQFLKTEFNLSLDFQALQQIITASPFWLDSLQWKVSTEDGFQRLDGRRPNLELNYYLHPTTYQLQRLSARIGKQSLNATFANFKVVEGSNQAIAHEIDIQIESEEAGKGRLLIEYNEISLLPPDNVRFEVPDHYTRKSRP